MKLYLTIAAVLIVCLQINSQNGLELAAQKIENYYIDNDEIIEYGTVTSWILPKKRNIPIMRNASFQIEKLNSKASFHYNWEDPKHPMIWNNFSIYSEIGKDSVDFCTNFGDRFFSSEREPLNLAIGGFIGSGGYRISRLIKLIHQTDKRMIDFQKNDTIFFRPDTIIDFNICKHVVIKTSVKKGKPLPKVELSYEASENIPLLPLFTTDIFSTEHIYFDALSGRILQMDRKTASEKQTSWSKTSFSLSPKKEVKKQKCD